MKTEQSDDKPRARSSALVNIVLGSAVKVIHAVRKQLLRNTGANTDSLLKPIVFDYSSDIPPELLAQLTGSYDEYSKEMQIIDTPADFDPLSMISGGK